MKNYQVIILTDSNRKNLEVHISNPLKQAEFLSISARKSYHTSVKRLVYFEEYESAFQAVQRADELTRFTRLQKEKLIRRFNPNWLSIQKQQIPLPTEVAVYA